MNSEKATVVIKIILIIVIIGLACILFPKVILSLGIMMLLFTPQRIAFRILEKRPILNYYVKLIVYILLISGFFMSLSNEELGIGAVVLAMFMSFLVDNFLYIFFISGFFIFFSNEGLGIVAALLATFMALLVGDFLNYIKDLPHVIKKEFRYMEGTPQNVEIYHLRHTRRRGPLAFVSTSTGKTIPCIFKDRAIQGYHYIFVQLNGNLFKIQYTDKFYDILSKSEICTLVMLPHSMIIIDITISKEELEANRINFRDKNLEGAIKEVLKIKQRDVLIKDLEEIKSLNLSGKNIQLLSGLEYAYNLETLNLESNNITDITPLASRKRLKELYLANNYIANIDALKELKDLEKLNLSYNNIINIEPLSNLEKLENLVLYHNKIKSVASIIKLNQLKYLDIRGNEISDYIELDNMNISTLLDDRLKIS